MSEQTDDLRPRRGTDDLNKRLGALALHWVPMLISLSTIAMAVGAGKYRLDTIEAALAKAEERIEKLQDEIAEKAAAAQLASINDKLNGLQQDVAVIKVTIERRH